MNPDKKRPQLEDVESRAEELNKPSSFLDSIRALAHKTHTKVLVLAAIAGLSAAPSCDQPKDKVAITDGNQNEFYAGCEPFTMCLTTGLYDEETKENIGFSFWYKVPEGETYDGVSFKVLDQDFNVIDMDVRSLAPGTHEFWVVKEGYEGDVKLGAGEVASGIEVEFPNGKVVDVFNEDFENPDDEPPQGI